MKRIQLIPQSSSHLKEGEQFAQAIAEDYLENPAILLVAQNHVGFFINNLDILTRLNDKELEPLSNPAIFLSRDAPLNQFICSRIRTETYLNLTIFNQIVHLKKTPSLKEQTIILQVLIRKLWEILSPYIGSIVFTAKDKKQEDILADYPLYLLYMVLCDLLGYTKGQISAPHLDFCYKQIQAVIAPYHPDIPFPSLEEMDLSKLLKHPEFYIKSHTMFAQIIQTLLAPRDTVWSLETLYELFGKQITATLQILQSLYVVSDFVYPYPPYAVQLLPLLIPQAALHKQLHDISCELPKLSVDTAPSALYEQLLGRVLALWEQVTPDLSILAQNQIARIFDAFLKHLQEVIKHNDKKPTIIDATLQPLVYLVEILQHGIQHIARQVVQKINTELDEKLTQVRLSSYTCVRQSPNNKTIERHYLDYLQFTLTPFNEKSILRFPAKQPFLYGTEIAHGTHDFSESIQHFWLNRIIGTMQNSLEIIKKVNLQNPASPSSFELIYGMLRKQYKEIQLFGSENTPITDCVKKQFADMFSYLMDVYKESLLGSWDPQISLFDQLYENCLRPTLFSAVCYSLHQISSKSIKEICNSLNTMMLQEITSHSKPIAPLERSAPQEQYLEIEAFLQGKFNPEMSVVELEKLAFALSQHQEHYLAFLAYTRFLVQFPTPKTYSERIAMAWRWIRFAHLANILNSHQNNEAFFAVYCSIEQLTLDTRFPWVEKIINILEENPLVSFSKTLQKEIKSIFYKEILYRLNKTLPDTLPEEEKEAHLLRFFETHQLCQLGLETPKKAEKKLAKPDYTGDILRLQKELETLEEVFKKFPPQSELCASLKSAQENEKKQLNTLEQYRMRHNQSEKILQEKLEKEQETERKLMAVKL